MARSLPSCRPFSKIFTVRSTLWACCNSCELAILTHHLSCHGLCLCTGMANFGYATTCVAVFLGDFSPACVSPQTLHVIHAVGIHYLRSGCANDHVCRGVCVPQLQLTVLERRWAPTARGGDGVGVCRKDVPNLRDEQPRSLGAAEATRIRRARGLDCRNGCHAATGRANRRQWWCFHTVASVCKREHDIRDNSEEWIAPTDVALVPADASQTLLFLPTSA